MACEIKHTPGSSTRMFKIRKVAVFCLDTITKNNAHHFVVRKWNKSVVAVLPNIIMPSFHASNEM